MPHDTDGDDQCVSMDTDVTRTPSAKGEMMAMDDDRTEENRETHVDHLTGAGDGFSVSARMLRAFGPYFI